jgi:hypothetical protein
LKKPPKNQWGTIAAKKFLHTASAARLDPELIERLEQQKAGNGGLQGFYQRETLRRVANTTGNALPLASFKSIFSILRCSCNWGRLIVVIFSPS